MRNFVQAELQEFLWQDATVGVNEEVLLELIKRGTTVGVDELDVAVAIGKVRRRSIEKETESLISGNEVEPRVSYDLSDARARIRRRLNHTSDQVLEFLRVKALVL